MANPARSLVMDLFGEYLRWGDNEARVGELITLLEVFDIEPATTRVTLSRMRRDGWFTTHRNGRETVYRLTPAMVEVLAEGRERIFTRADGQWDGSWTQVIYQVPESARSARESLRKQLTWLGFGQFAASTWFAPRDVVAEVEPLRAAVPEATIDALRTTTTALTSAQELARRCWDLEELAEEYHDFLRRYVGLDDPGARPTDGPSALALRTALVADARRLTFRDPLLPTELVPADWPGGAAFDLFVRVHDALEPTARAYVEEVVGRELELTPA